MSCILLLSGGKWLGFRAYLRSGSLETALEKNAIILSGFYPFKNRINNTYTTLESFDEITKGTFGKELLIELTPGFHKISCTYEGTKALKQSVGKAVTVVYKFEKGKIYIPFGTVIGRKWLLELKEYSDIDQVNPKFLKRLSVAFDKFNKNKQTKKRR